MEQSTSTVESGYEYGTECLQKSLIRVLHIVQERSKRLRGLQYSTCASRGNCARAHPHPHRDPKGGLITIVHTPYSTVVPGWRPPTVHHIMITRTPYSVLYSIASHPALGVSEPLVPPGRDVVSDKASSCTWPTLAAYLCNTDWLDKDWLVSNSVGRCKCSEEAEDVVTRVIPK